MKKVLPSQGDLFGSKTPAIEKAASVVETSLPVPAWRQPVAEPVVLTVGELTRRLKQTIEQGFSRVLVRGEVSGFRGANVRGHLYFSLKDAEATLEAKIWSSMASRMKFRLTEGMAVVAEGSLDLYAPSGRYSLIIQRIEPEGVGALALAFAQLKERLTQEGLIGEQRSRPPRPLPFLPERVGVVTSLTGAALRDFLRVLHNRHPRLPVLICDARVQGEGAARDVVKALEWLSRTDVDVIVVTRGGGSIEDLWTFNEEVVARAIHACPIPVVSAIGHEVDFTIADFVADARAPTPSAAAEMLAPVLKDLELQLATSGRRLQKAMERTVVERHRQLVLLQARLPDPRRRLHQERLYLSETTENLGSLVRSLLGAEKLRLRQLHERLSQRSPQGQLVQTRQALHRHQVRLLESMRAIFADEKQRLHDGKLRLANGSPRGPVAREKMRVGALESRLKQAIRSLIEAKRARLLSQVGALHALSPLAVMSRGYALAYTSAGRVIHRAEDVQVGELISVRVSSKAIQSMAEADVLVAKVEGRKIGA